MTPRRARTATLVAIAAVTLAFAALAWHRRWISDDGLIYVRTIRQIVAGNGPVFNAVERTEANTSTLWPWLVAGIYALAGADPARLTVLAGGVLSVAGLLLAMAGTLRLHRARGSTAALVPGGVLVVLGVAPFWDFATSGLETGLCTLWLAAIWWCLVELGAESTPRRQRWTAFVLGLGPLVRPDLAVPAGVFLVAAWWIVRPARRRTLGLAAIAAALPAAYEVFRAGYYGALVPLPALAKSATGSAWGRGVRYLADFVHPYWLIVPTAVLVTLLAVAVRRGALAGRVRVVVAAPVVSGLLLAVYVLKVGGDFMHARMWLPPALLAVLPALLVPWRRWTAPAMTALATWALAIATVRAHGETQQFGDQIEDEREGYVRYTRDPHPVDAAAYSRAIPDVVALVDTAVRTGERRLISESGVAMAIRPSLPAPVALVVGRLGTGGAIAPLDGIVGDTLGLANPIGARITRTNRVMAGHEKALPWAWLAADLGDPEADDAMAGDAPLARAASRAAVHAMTCGPIAELLASVREPMSLARFWANLTGAPRRTALVIPSSPFAAERTFCDRLVDPDLALGALVDVSSSYEASGWSSAGVVDGLRASIPGHSGFCSALGNPQPHEEWIELKLPIPATFSRVVLHPSHDVGFPIDFAIQVLRDGAWAEVARRVDYPAPVMAAQVIALPAPVTTRDLRLDATRLRNTPHGYVLQLAEIELLP